MRTAYAIFLICFCIAFSSCTGKTSLTVTDHYNSEINRQFWTVDWSPDGKYIAVGGVDSLLRIYTSKKLHLTYCFPVQSWIHAVKWHPDGNILAIATLDRYVLLLNPRTGPFTTLDHIGGSRAIGWNADGSWLAIGDLDGDIQVWHKVGKLLSAIDNVYGKESFGTSYLSVDWHPYENKFLATNFQISILDHSGQLLDTMHHSNPQAIMLCVKWHPSGQFFVVGDYGHDWDGEHVPSLLHFWTSGGHWLKSVSGSKAEYRNIAWNPTGTLLATASDLVRIWDSKGTLLYEGLPDHTNFLWGIDWSPKGDKIVPASRYRSVSIWDKKQSNCVALMLTNKIMLTAPHIA